MLKDIVVSESIDPAFALAVRSALEALAGVSFERALEWRLASVHP